MRLTETSPTLQSDSIWPSACAVGTRRKGNRKIEKNREVRQIDLGELLLAFWVARLHLHHISAPPTACLLRG